MPEPRPGAGEQLAAPRGGSRQALGELLEACRAYLLIVAEQELATDLRRKAGASGLVQETFLQAQRDVGRFQGESENELRAWLRQVLINNLANERAAELEQALASLSPEQRQNLALRHYEALPFEEIGRRMNRSLDQALGLLRQAVAAGFKDAAKLKAVKSSNPFRPRPDFQ